MDEEHELIELYGPAAPYSDYKRGERVAFNENGQVYTGEILWVCSTGEVAGKPTPVNYIVIADQQDGFPCVVWAGDIVEKR